MKIYFVRYDNLLGRSDCKNALLPKLFWNPLDKLWDEYNIGTKIAKMSKNQKYEDFGLQAYF